MSQATRSNSPTPAQAANRPRRIFPLVVCMLLLGGFAATDWLASLHESATTDEPVSLFSAWACTQLHDFRCDPENPPLWKYYVGIGMRDDDWKTQLQSPRWRQMLEDSHAQGPLASEALYSTPGVDADTLLRGGRARMILLGVVLGAMIGWWAWRVAGPLAAMVATAFFCLDPNFLAHTPLIKNDVAVTLAFLWLMAMAWLVGERATFFRLALLALALAATVMTKFSGVLAIPILGVLLLLRSVLPAPWSIGPCNARTRRGRMAAAATIFLCSLLVTWGLTWACYDFRFAPTNDPRESFDLHRQLETCAAHERLAQSDDPFNVPSQVVQEFVRDWKPPASVRLLLAANSHRLLPQSCVSGLLGVFAWSRGRVAFLCGESSVVGWWRYFPLAMTFKTPLATLLGVAISLILFAVQKPLLNSAGGWTLAVAAIPPLLYFSYAMSSRVDVGIRHIFPVYPFLFILLGAAASLAHARFGKSAAVIAAVLVLALAIETYSAFPNYIPFFNFAAGGSRGGLRLLSESNIDWGQDLPDLARWQRQNPDRQIYLCYWGSADPRYYGIHYMNLQASDAPTDQVVPRRPSPVYVFSAVALTQPGFRKLYKPLLDSFQNHQPVSILDGSLYIYSQGQ